MYSAAVSSGKDDRNIRVKFKLSGSLNMVAHTFSEIQKSTVSLKIFYLFFFPGPLACMPALPLQRCSPLPASLLTW